MIDNSVFVTTYDLTIDVKWDLVKYIGDKCWQIKKRSFNFRVKWIFSLKRNYENRPRLGMLGSLHRGNVDSSFVHRFRKQLWGCTNSKKFFLPRSGFFWTIFASSTQLELQVFEFFGILAWFFFKILLEFFHDFLGIFQKSAGIFKFLKIFDDKKAVFRSTFKFSPWK